MSSPVAWQQDQNGNYYYWKHNEGCYVYRNGYRWNPTTQTLIPPPPQQLPEVPQTPRGAAALPGSPNPPAPSSLSSPTRPGQYTTAHWRQTSFSSDGSASHIPRSQYDPTQAPPSASLSGGGPTTWEATVVDSASYQDRTALQTGNQAGYAPIVSRNPSGVQSTVTNPSSDNQQPGYLPKRHDWEPRSSVPSASGSHPAAQGPSSHGTLKPIHRAIQGTPGECEQLDPRYKKRNSKWFRRGRVFKMHWSQPMDDSQANNSKATIVTEIAEHLPKEYEKYLPPDVVRSKQFGQYVFSKIRWFIVVREGVDKCLCVPINTHRGQGVRQNDVKNEHAIVHTTREAPAPTAQERPGRGEKPMRTAIRVTTDEKGDKFLPMSRIDYGRVYTVEQNVKAMAFGWVHEDSMKDLTFDFMDVFMGDEGYKDWRKAQKQQQAGEDSDESDESEEENEDDGDNDGHDDDNDGDDVDEEPAYQDPPRRGHAPAAPAQARAPAPTTGTATAARGYRSGAPGKRPLRK